MAPGPTRGEAAYVHQRAFCRRPREKRATFRCRDPHRVVTCSSCHWRAALLHRADSTVPMKTRSRLRSLLWMVLSVAGAICCTRLESGSDTFGVTREDGPPPSAGATTGAQA